MSKAVLAFSGGLDTSVCIPLLNEEYGYDDIIAVTVDVGQPKDDLDEAYERADELGLDHRVVDATEEFVDEYLFSLGTSLARPVIARHCLDIALEEDADALVHGCTGKGNDQLRFEAVWRESDLEIIAPMREHNLTREWEIEYAQEHGINVSATKEKPWSIDSNLWSRSVEGGELEDPGVEPPEEVFNWTSSADDAPDDPETVGIGFEKGVPVSIDGKVLKPVKVISRLNDVAGKHGVGRNDMIEDRVLGLKVREVYEHPAATVLLKTHADLESLVLTRSQLKFKNLIEEEWSELAYKGLVNEPLYEDLNAFIDSTQEKVTGEVRVKLSKGNIQVVGRESRFGLYSEDMASFDTGSMTDTIDQTDAEGYSKYHGLQGRLAKKAHKE
ncbi:MAG: argininosuccinate synthase [Halobacteria archaeon]|nr:argininosuccinate synthase [Halobacteria archaeon]